MTTEEFISQNRDADIRTLPLKLQRYPDLDAPFIINQINGWQRARHKLPLWAQTDGIIYPPQISMEQCSSEETARYKARLSAPALSASPSASPSAPSPSNTPRPMQSPAIFGRTPAPSPIPSSPSSTTTFLDLTGGFGVDFSYMSRPFTKAIYVEQQAHLCDIARHNFQLLGMHNATVINATAEDFLAAPFPPVAPFPAVGSVPRSSAAGLSSSPSPSHPSPSPLTIFLDPARRDTQGRKTYAITDCTPDVLQLLPRLRELATTLIIKLSPMLDITDTLRRITDITEVHILSVKNECKEILLKIIPGSSDQPRIYCVNDDSIYSPQTPASGDAQPTAEPPSFPALKEMKGSAETPAEAGSVLCVPNASVMKAGCFRELCHDFRLTAFDANSHLFLAPEVPANFPGRTFKILSTTTLNKRSLKQAMATAAEQQGLESITSASIACRNFPMSPDELRRRLRLRDGGTTYIFATTFQRQHLLFICMKTPTTPPQKAPSAVV